MAATLPPPSSDLHTSTPGANGRPVLLAVDDEASILRLYEEALGDRYELELVSRAELALQRLRERAFDLILSDISMPGMSGLELLREVRAVDLDVPVLLVTGHPTLEGAMQAVEYGAFRYVTKPLRIQDLEQAVAAGLRMHDLARTKREAYAIVSGEEGRSGDRAGLEARFGQALGELWLAYHPILCWPRREVLGYELLLRSAESTLAHPQALLQAAAELARGQELGRAIRARAAESFAQLPEGMNLFVNLRIEDLDDPDLMSVEAPLSAVARRVVLEITEHASIENAGRARAQVRQLRQMGFRIAVDDLGAGHNGLATFAHLSPDFAKLDIALVRGIHNDGRRRQVVGGLVRMCREMEVVVIAEGVEVVAERDALTLLGCEYLQGFLFGQPEPVATPPVW